MRKSPETTSNLTCRLAIRPPPGPATVTDGVAVWPEQTALVPHAAEFGVTVKPLRSGAGWTVTAADAMVPAESWTLTVTAVGSPTGAGRRTIVFDEAPRLIGSTAVSLEKALYGGTPPEMVNVW